jgi:DNA polymerase-3 subunit beta
VKVLCKRKELLYSLGNVASVVPSRSPRPILQNLHFAATDDGCTLMATDLEVGAKHGVLGVTIYEPGSAILPTQKLSAILSASPDAELSIESDGESLTISGQQSRFKLPAEDPSLFPAVSAWAAEAWWTVNAGDLRRAIRRTVWATDAESTRYSLSGGLFQADASTLTVVATDGRRLAKVVVVAEPTGDPVPPSGSPVVPAKAMKLVDRILDDEEMTVDFAFVAGAGGSATAILFRTGDGRSIVYSRLVEGRFPRYQDVFPGHHEVRIPLDVASLRQAVQQAAIVTSDESRGVDFRFAGDTLTLASQAADVGSSVVEMPAHNEGPPVDVTFDPRYLTDALKTIGDDSGFAVELIDHKNAAVFRTEDQYTYVVMPLTRDR